MGITTKLQFMQDQRLSGAPFMPGMVFLIFTLQPITLGDQLSKKPRSLYEIFLITEMNFTGLYY